MSSYPSSPDVRFERLDPAFERLIAQLGQQFQRIGQARGGRAFHLRATTLAGELSCAPDAALPPHAFLGPGRTYPVLVRHANGMQEDDAAPDNRGATVRVLDPAAPDALDRGLWDLLLTTGRCFMQPTAERFARWMRQSAGEREAAIADNPHWGEALWEMLRRPEAFETLHYHSKTASRFDAADGSRHHARYRLTGGAGEPDHGFLTPDGPMPPDVLRRDDADDRPRDYLHRALAERFAAGPIGYRLEVQLRPAAGDGSDEDALDCTRPWDEAAHPWRLVGTLRLDRAIAPERVEPLAFNPVLAPAGLGLVTAARPDQTGSLNHLRSIVYDMAAAQRRGEAMPEAVGALIARSEAAPETPAGPAPLRVCVVGAGPSGLTAARELEKRGHRVTVFEAADALGGKAASIAIGDRAYDWGGHFCSSNYRALGALVAELGVPIEPATHGRPFDLATREVLPLGDTRSLGNLQGRYLAARRAHFGALPEPGLKAVARALAAPAIPGLAALGLSDYGDALGVVFTASGYGYLQDPALSALYFLKSADTTFGGDATSPLPLTWTIAGGFGRLWEAVASELDDVRTGVAVTAVERHDAGVRVQTTEGAFAFDALIVATPLHDVPPYLDATDEERAVFGAVRHLDYYTTIVSATGLPELGFYFLKPHVDDPASAGHTVAIHHRYAGDDVYLCYAYGAPGLDGDDVVRKLREDVARMGGAVTAVHAQRRWAYFPHFSADDVAAGLYDRLEALQGVRRTHYLGSLFNFELMECNVAYAQALVARAFGPAPERAPAPAVALPEPTPAAPEHAMPAPGDPAAMLGWLQALLRRELDVEVTPLATTAFMDLGIDSLRAMELLQRVSAESGLALTPLAFFDYPTLGEMAAHLAAEAGAAAPGAVTAARPAAAMPMAPSAPLAPGGAPVGDAGWFRALRGPVRMRLFFFPPAGGNAEMAEAWPGHLGPDVELVAMQMPGRGRRGAEAPAESFEACLDALAEAIAPWCDRPFAFFGHSMGALVAFELTRRLRRAGRPLPERLFLSAFPGRACAEAARTPSASDRAAMAPPQGWGMLADLALIEGWASPLEAPLAVPMTVLGGQDDPLVGPEALEAWRTEAAAGFERVALPGDHHYLLRDPLPALAFVRARLEHPPTPPRPARPAAAPLPPGLQGALDALRRAPAQLDGPLGVYDLAWAARAVGPDGRALFPRALDALAAALDAEPAPALVPASELAAWAVAADAFLAADDDWRAELAVGRCRDALDRLAAHPPFGVPAPDAHHAYPGGPAGWLTPLGAVSTLLDGRAGRLFPGDREALEAFRDACPGREALAAYRRADAAPWFRMDALALQFGEFLVDDALTGPDARAHAARAGGLAGFALPLAARYAEVTGDPAAIAAVERLLERPEATWPATGYFEAMAASYYVARAGLDAASVCAPELATLDAGLLPDGAPFFPGIREADPDTTAWVLGLAHRTGRSAPWPTESLERFWRPAEGCYLHLDGLPRPNASTTLHVLEAFLLAPDVAPERLEAVFARTLGQLEAGPWVEHYHLSPLYVDELAVSVVMPHAHRFPGHSTAVAERALERVLGAQRPDGGFGSAWAPGSNTEETALALFALATALAVGGPHTDTWRRAAEAGRAWLAAAPPAPPLAWWNTKVAGAVPHAVAVIREAALVAIDAALAAPRGSRAPVPAR